MEKNDIKTIKVTKTDNNIIKTFPKIKVEQRL